MTKKCEVLWLILMIFCIISISKISSEAVDSGFSVEDVSESEKENFKSEFSLVSNTTADRSFIVFDVNEDGMIALGHDLPRSEKRISVYDSNGNYQYGYSFESYGSFGVEWNGDYLNVYFVRSNYLVTLDREANILEVSVVADTKENKKHKNDYVFSKEKTVGNERYTMRNELGNFPSTAYTQLVKTSGAEETVIYNSEKFYTFSVFLIPVMIPVAFLIGTAIICYPFIFKKH